MMAEEKEKIISLGEELPEERIVGMAIHEEYAKFIYRETNPNDGFRKPEALDDMLVLDVSYGSYAGLFASSILSEFGAEVIRIEPPEGDIARKMTPFGIMIKDSGLPYIAEGGRNKFHITLNIESDEGREMFKKLAKKADVIIETFKPGYMDSLGIGYRQLSEINPSLIYSSISSYGQCGEDAEKHSNQPNYDIIDQARGLIMSVMGEPELDPELPKEFNRPLKHGNWMGWLSGGAWAAYGILIAMFVKRKTGKGQFIDCAPSEGLISMANYLLEYFHMSGDMMPRAGNYDYAVFPYSYFKCKDGYTFLSGFTDPNWAALCEIMDRPDLQERFPTTKERLTPKNQPIIQHEIEKFTSQYTTDEILQLITEYSRRPDKKGTVVTGKLENTTEVLERQHWKDRQTFVKVNDPYYGEVIAHNMFNTMSRTPGRVKWVCRPIGADNGFIYNKYLGLGGGKLSELKEKGVI